MKNIKLIFSVSFCIIIVFIAVVSCNKNNSTIATQNNGNSNNHKTRGANYAELGMNITETYYSISNLSNIESLLATAKLRDACFQAGFSLGTNVNSVKVTNTIDGKYVYTVDMNSINTNISGGLIILPIDESRNFYAVFIAKMVTVNGETTPHLTNIIDNIDIFNSSTHPPFMPKNTKAWWDCISTAWAELTNDLLGTIACCSTPANTSLCLAACVIHCSISGTAPQGYSNAQALQWLCDNGFIICNGSYIDNSVTFIAL